MGLFFQPVTPPSPNPWPVSKSHPQNVEHPPFTLSWDLRGTAEPGQEGSSDTSS